MRSVKDDNKTLDEIGERLFKRRARGQRVVDEAIANADLFAGVLKRIAEEPKAVRPGFRLYAGTLASVAVLTIAAIGAVSLLRSSNKELANAIAVQDPAPQSVPVAARPDLPPPSVGIEEIDTLQGRAPYRPARTERPVLQNASYTPARDSRPQPVNRPRDEFYAISGAEAGDASGGRIIRVDLSRSALFALGVNVPLENDSETVKADLLIGPDGVARAIRVVR